MGKVTPMRPAQVGQVSLKLTETGGIYAEDTENAEFAETEKRAAEKVVARWERQ